MAEPRVQNTIRLPVELYEWLVRAAGPGRVNQYIIEVLEERRAGRS